MRKILFIFLASIALVIWVERPLPAIRVDAASIADLQAQINDRNAKLAELEKEIAAFQKELNSIGVQAKNLQGNIKQLDTTKAKLNKEIQSAQLQIDQTKVEIRELSAQVAQKKDEVGQNERAVIEALQNLDQAESSSVIGAFLGERSLSIFFDQIESTRQVQDVLRSKVETLRTLQAQLETSVNETKEKEAHLVSLQTQLSDKKTLVEYEQQQKNKLLSDTKSKETNYQKILTEKKALRDSFNKELIEFESQLKLAIDPNSIPKAINGVLAWPVDKVIVTQTFGNTEFAQAHSQLYNGRGHNGIDLGIPTGTTLKAALGGAVKGTGNTDAVCPGASYGKWVLIEHSNGLSTLYAHLSLIKVTEGQKLSTGETIGYSGATGYATGPHLHFTVYATQGVQILKRQSKVCGGAYTMPIADLKAYLNPLTYLPAV